MKILVLAAALFLGSTTLTQSSIANDTSRSNPSTSTEKGGDPLDVQHQVCVTVWLTWCWWVSG